MDGSQTPQGCADVLDATGLDAQLTPREGTLTTRPCGLVEAEEIEVCHETVVVSISDVCAEHVTMVRYLKCSAQAITAEYSFGVAV